MTPGNAVNAARGLAHSSRQLVRWSEAGWNLGARLRGSQKSCQEISGWLSDDAVASRDDVRSTTRAVVAASVCGPTRILGRRGTVSRPPPATLTSALRVRQCVCPCLPAAAVVGPVCALRRTRKGSLRSIMVACTHRMTTRQGGVVRLTRDANFYAASDAGARSYKESMAVGQHVAWLTSGENNAASDAHVRSYNAAIKAWGSAGDWERSTALLSLMWGMGKTSPNAESYRETIAACGKAGEWRQAVALLRQMHEKGVAANDSCYGEAIKACNTGHQWKQALDLFEEMSMVGVPADVLSYDAAIAACGNSGQFERAIALLRQMQTQQARGVRDVAPKRSSYNAAIAACEREGHCEQAVALLREMEKRKGDVTPNEQSYSAAIIACGNGRQWKQAVALLREMKEHGVAPGVAAYSAAVKAGRNGRRPGATLALLREMQKKGMKPDRAVFKAAITACRNGSRSKEAVALLREMTTPDADSYNAVVWALLRRRGNQRSRQQQMRSTLTR